MQVRTENLIGAQLDWAVAQAAGYSLNTLDLMYDIKCYSKFKPSTDWAQGGPILTREHISRTIDHSGLWIAYWTDGYTDGDEGKKWMQCDRSELVAGLRCYVASELGDKVEVPDELA